MSGARGAAIEVRIEPISDGDLDHVGDFLNANINKHVSAQTWRHSFDLSRRFSTPNNGMMLLAGDAIVGVYLAYYSKRGINGRDEGFCNHGPWSVQPSYRLHAAGLLNAQFAQPGCHFSDLSPNRNVIPINEHLGFQFLDSRSAILPAVPSPWRPGTITGNPLVQREALDEPERLYLDHARSPPPRHVLVRDGRRSCFLVFRMDRRTKLSGVLAVILDASDKDLFRTMLRPFLGYLLFRRGTPAMLSELRVTGHRPRGSLLLTSFRWKMFKSPTLDPTRLDYFYSELVTVPVDVNDARTRRSSAACALRWTFFAQNT
jgi:hypothetical protein